MTTSNTTAGLRRHLLSTFYLGLRPAVRAALQRKIDCRALFGAPGTSLLRLPLAPRRRFVLAISSALILTSICWAAAGGSISGTVVDSSGAVVPGAALTLINIALKSEYKATTDAKGFYSFPSVPVGHYDLVIKAAGFKAQMKTNLTVDTDAAFKVDAILEVGAQSETVTVSATAAASQAQVDTITTSLGEVVTGAQATALPLNGRSYTDLLSIQPGIIPVTTILPSTVIMAGVTGTLSPSGDLNPGNLSIDGQRESSNGFMVNGINVQEPMNGGTSIVPNLDSIEEFRVLTNNFDAEYGNYNGGIVTVVTKSGSDSFHGNAFEFMRNTALDARGYFDPTRAAFRQNQFGGTLGGPIKRQKAYFFVDYQGTRTTEGVDTGLITVPSLQDRTGNLSDVASSLTGAVSGPYLANLLSQKLGYTVSAGEPYYTPGCNNSAACVFPNAVIPQSAWSAPALNLLKYIPSPNVGSDQFSTAAYPETVRDDKAGARADFNTREGEISTYYFIDDYSLNNPYPGQQGGASIPGFNALTYGLAQLISLQDTKVLGTSTVNQFNIGFLRNANVIGQPSGGLGVSLASQGFATGPGNSGIVVQAPQFEGVENIVFPTFVMGVPITNETQDNNTLYFSDSVSKVIGLQTLKFGGEFHLDQVNEHPNATFNGTFNIDGTETGSAFADFLIGVPSNYTQSSGQPFYLRNHYAALFGEDSWRVRRNLTLNMGLRWEYIRPFSEKYNNIQTIIPGMQSVLYPGAPNGLVVPGDPGIPSTLSAAKWDKFAPRLGVAYAPQFNHGILEKIFGNGGKSSIRASYGVFYTAFPGLSAGIMYGVPPFGYNYLSPSPPLLATPFINANNGTANTDPFPLTFPPHNVSINNPDTSFNFTSVLPISADPYFYYRNTVPYTENYILSFGRQLTAGTLLTMSYVGNQGHHILMLVPTNLGNPALCLSLSQPSEVAPGTPTCGPFGEDSTYISRTGQVYYGTRMGLGSSYGEATGQEIYGENTAQETVGNSSYNALETTLRYVGKRSNALVGYTYSKCIDQGSNLGEEINPLDPSATRTICAFDIRHSFVASYTLNLPFAQLFRHDNRVTNGWSWSAIVRLSTGLPVTLYDDSDNSLLGTLGNGVNNNLLDTPNYSGGALEINTNPRNGLPEFNVSAFTQEALGQLGNAPRRFFYGPGQENVDMTVTKLLRLTESKALEFRVEAFNVFNHAQFFGPATVDGEINDPHFGDVVSADAPRLVQLAAKLSF